MNAPLTVEVAAAWTVAKAMRGQVRAIPGGVVGWDIGTGLAMAAAWGCNPLVAVEVLVECEPMAIAAINRHAKSIAPT